MTATKMKEKPIRLRDWEVRAIIAGTKTRLSVPVKPQPVQKVWFAPMSNNDWYWQYPDNPANGRISSKPNGPDGWEEFCPLGKVGDRLWVRETWKWFGRELASGIEGGFQYRADLADDPKIFRSNHEAFRQAWKKKTVNKWQPSTTFPRWASRLTLEIESVKVERAQDISEADAKAEGVEMSPVFAKAKSGDPLSPCHTSFVWNWWERYDRFPGRPWLWAITFRRLEQ